MAAEIPTYDKTPSELLDFSVDWTEWLAGPDGTLTDTINSSSWLFPTTPDTALVDDHDDNSDKVITKWVSGGTVGRVYVLTNSIVTVADRHASRTIKIYIVATR